MGPTGESRVVQIHPTRRCNLRCLHCYSSSSPEERGMLDAALLFSAVEDIATEGFNWISLSGGEPLLYPPLPDLLSHAKAHSLKTALVTNGMLLNRSHLDRIASHTDLLVISIDGKPDSHNAIRGSKNAFNIMASRLADIDRCGIPFGFIFTLTQHNLDELPWVAEFAANSGAKLLQIHPLESVGNATEQLPGKVPDAIEAAYAWVLAQEIQKTVGDRMAIQIDLVFSEAVKQNPELIYADASSITADEGLAETISPLVIEADGTVVPLQYGFSRKHALGNLHDAPLSVLADRWQEDRWSEFKAVCNTLYEQVSVATKPYFFNWYEEIATLADQQAMLDRATTTRIPLSEVTVAS